jgi:oxygen-independent coproporphyrinogen III oxidase
MRFGIYVHIPYCLQKCHYCDFITFDMNHKLSPKEYVTLICAEIHARSSSIAHRQLNSLYFGGGTPSVLHPDQILTIRDAIANEGFVFADDCEITIEINPGTVTSEKLDLYLAAGVNRFSVGVQTFNANHLRQTGRLHSVADSRELLTLLSEKNLNFSFDLLFGLPHQGLNDVEKDLRELLSFRPPHVSLYNLTVPKTHMMNEFRVSDDEQAQMFSLIDSHLTSAGIHRYEISNFSRAGFESKHNDLYWSDQPYWGLGVGAHSYLPDAKPFGARFWNPATAASWASQVESLTGTPYFESLPETQLESLKAHESLTDFCHTSLRKLSGLNLTNLKRKYGPKTCTLVEERLLLMVKNGLLKNAENTFFLDPSAYARANMVFLELTFLSEDLAAK